MKKINYISALLMLTVFLLLGCGHTQEVKNLIIENQKIAFTTNRDGNDEIYIMNLDGSKQINITNHPSNDSQPVWSPDGKRIAFITDRDGSIEIYTMNSDGSEQTNLTNNSSYDYFPRWSPDGKQILFISYRDEIFLDPAHPVPELYLMNSDGSNQTRLTHNTNEESFFSWLQSDNLIALTMVIQNSNTGVFTKEIFKMDLSNNEIVQLTSLPHQNDYPVWSPDGNRIAFVSYRSGPAEIFVMNPDGLKQVQITYSDTNIIYNLHPSWSPDGLKIAYTSNISGNYDIYIMQLDNYLSTRLTDDTSIDSFPSWSPVP